MRRELDCRCVGAEAAYAAVQRSVIGTLRLRLVDPICDPHASRGKRPRGSATRHGRDCREDVGKNYETAQWLIPPWAEPRCSRGSFAARHGGVTRMGGNRISGFRRATRDSTRSPATSGAGEAPNSAWKKNPRRKYCPTRVGRAVEGVSCCMGSPIAFMPVASRGRKGNACVPLERRHPLGH